MNDASWDRITDAIDTQYGLKDHGRSTRPLADAAQFTEQVRFVTFVRGGETFKLERVTGPAILDRKTVGARRAGAELHFENVYDPEETAHRVNLYKKDGDDWVAIDPSALGL